MEYAIGILATVVIGLIWWALDHARSCSNFHERVAALEEWKKLQERNER